MLYLTLSIYTTIYLSLVISITEIHRKTSKIYKNWITFYLHFAQCRAIKLSYMYEWNFHERKSDFYWFWPQKRSEMKGTLTFYSLGLVVCALCLYKVIAMFVNSNSTVWKIRNFFCPSNFYVKLILANMDFDKLKYSQNCTKFQLSKCTNIGLT